MAFSEPSPFPVLISSNASSLEEGTVYTFSNVVTDDQDITSELVHLIIDGAYSAAHVFLDGYCTRTGASAAGYCHFTWSLFDIRDDYFLGSISGQGILQHSALDPGNIAVTGGTGLFTGVTGVVEVDPAVVDERYDPPFVESAPEGTDVFDEVDGYLHTFFLEANQEFLESSHGYLDGEDTS